MRLASLICALLALLPAAATAQEETRNYPLGPIGGQFRVTPNSSYARIVSLDAAAPGVTSGLQVGDYLFGAFGKTFTPTGTYHHGVSQELGFAVDRAEGAGGSLPLKVLRPGVGSLDVTVTLPSAGTFGAAYPRASAKHQASFESACAWLHQRVMSTSNGDVGYPTGWSGLCLLGHPNWNDTTGAKPYRLSINKIRDRCVQQINAGVYAAVEDKLFDGTANPNYVGGALSNWQLGQFVMFLSEYYAKTADATVAPAIQRGAEMCANTVQWWKQPALGTTYTPAGTQIAGMVSHGGVIGDYIHLGWGGGINMCGVYSFNGMAFARHVGMDMTVRPRDGHYFGYPTAPVGAVEVGKENYDHTLDEKFQMQWNWMGKRTAYYNSSSNDDGHVAYTLNAPTGWDAAGRTPATALGMDLYKRNGGALTADDEDKLARLKAYTSRHYIRQQEAHAYCVGAQAYHALATAFLTDRQQRFMLDNWRFYYALSRTHTGGFQYFRSRSVNDSYLDETQCAAIDMALPYVIANGGLNIIPSINDAPDQVIANFQSPNITWPTIDARKISHTGSTLAMPVSLVDGQGAAVSSGYSAAWTKLSGPGTVTFSQPSAATTDMTFSMAGSYRVQLSVTRGSYTLVEPIDVSVSIHPAPAGYIAGLANYQVYTGLTGTLVTNLTGATKFPNSPDVTRTVTRLTGDFSGDNYGARLTGCVIAPVTGSYRFYIASDDGSQLKFNSSGLGAVSPTAIASVTGSTAVNQWNKYGSQQSVAFNLTAGQAYSFEALHKEGTGADLLSIGWAINGGAIEVIDGAYIAAPDSTPATMSITAHPQPASTTRGGSVTLSVATTGPQPGFYQWRRNGVNMGAPTNSPSLTFANVSGGAAGDYDCVFTTTLGTLTSTAAQVTVTDTGALVSGGLWREVYTGIGGSAVTDLTSQAKFPFNADSSGPITSAATTADYGEDYGQRITGWIKPTVTGNYRFYLTSDDNSELWLGTSEQAATKSRIHQLSGYTDPKGWSQRSPSAYIALQAGKYYYFEVRHKEGGGGDHLAVAWQRQGDAAPANGSGEIPGQFLSYRLGGSFDDVAVGNQAPSFAADPVARPDAPVAMAYTGQSLAPLASDFNSADALVFSKLPGGPAWLNVAPNGALSGTPQAADLGVNTFTVRVADPSGLEDIATLNITVIVPPTWINSSGGSWITAGNWQGGIPSGTGAYADFSTLNLTTSPTVTLDGARTIGTLVFGDTSPSHGWTLNTGSGGPLTLAVASDFPVITVTNQTTTIGAVLAGNQGWVKAGDGSLVLTGTNTYTGATKVSAGTLQLGNGTIQPTLNSTYDIASGATLRVQYNTATGAAAQTWSKYTGAGTLALETGKNFDFGWGTAGLGAGFTGTLQMEGGRTSTTSAAGGGLGSTTRVVVKTGGQLGMWTGGTFSQDFTIEGTGYGEGSGYDVALRFANDNLSNNTLNGTITLTGSATIGAKGTGVATLNGAISESAPSVLTFGTTTLNGTVILTAANTYPGGTVVAAGTLEIAGSGSLGNGTYGGNISNAGTLRHSSSASQTLSGVISGAGALTKTGTATLTLSGSNNYIGATSITGGALLVNGALGNTATTINAASTLGGSGSIAGTVSNSGTLAPGNNAVGNLTVNNTLTLAGGSKVTWEINNWTGAAGTGWDKATVSSLSLTATSGNPITIRPVDLALANFTETNASFVLIQTSSSIPTFSADKFTVDTSGLTLPQGTWAVQQAGNNLVLVYTAVNPDTNGNGIYDTWEAANFGNANPGANLPGDDADKDGLTNLMEYALGTNPLVYTAGPVADLETVADKQHLRLTVNKNPQATNLTYTVETCGALNDWSDVNVVVEADTATQLIVRDSFNTTTSSTRFIRLKVQAGP
ncbi:DUF6288 domain-containing protein [Luteolibacter arcticus]|uniref:DUF6288 domain-containing protein n=1 Tax=Luteolibacter arcticus TaxID=1581411 RepID=A0ABT3GQM4_9BACT|nr:DUF6288 domain-containing protein [Luteolibacter arcticus]MCW1925827.1 DUF6288 domain-containing protein [Luteolibacter arcticus]